MSKPMEFKYEIKSPEVDSLPSGHSSMADGDSLHYNRWYVINHRVADTLTKKPRVEMVGTKEECETAVQRWIEEDKQADQY